MKIAIVATSGESLVNFRGKLIQEWINLNHEVTCISVENPSSVAESINKLGAKYYQVAGDRTGTGILNGFNMIADYKKAYRDINPDLVFLYMSKPIAFGGIAAIRSNIKRIIVFQTGLEIAFYSTGIKNAFIRIVLKMLYWYVQRRAEAVFFMCHEDQRKMIQWHLVKEEQTAYVDGSGVDMQHFVKTPLPIEPVVCMIARLVWSKGIREYIEAARIIKKMRPELKVKFQLVGGLDTNSESLSKDELEVLTKQGVVEYCGYQNNVLPYLQKCSIFVLPSYHEGKGKVILEAQAVGRPIITTTAPGCSETVVEGYNGYKVPAHDAAALAKKIIYLAEHPEIREIMSENAYKYCKKTFDVNIINKVFLKRMKMI